MKTGIFWALVVLSTIITTNEGTSVLSDGRNISTICVTNGGTTACS